MNDLQAQLEEVSKEKQELQEKVALQKRSVKLPQRVGNPRRAVEQLRVFRKSQSAFLVGISLR